MRSKTIVLKFGGTSVGSIERIKIVSKIILFSTAYIYVNILLIRDFLSELRFKSESCKNIAWRRKETAACRNEFEKSTIFGTRFDFWRLPFGFWSQRISPKKLYALKVIWHNKV